MRGSGEAELFREIWNERERVSFLSGDELKYVEGSEFWWNLFAHVLPKGKFPHFRLNKDNIVLLTPHEHHLLDHSTEARRQSYSDNWEMVYLLEAKLWLQYKKQYGHCPIIKRVLDRI